MFGCKPRNQELQTQYRVEIEHIQLAIVRGNATEVQAEWQKNKQKFIQAHVDLISYALGMNPTPEIAVCLIKNGAPVHSSIAYTAMQKLEYNDANRDLVKQILRHSTYISLPFSDNEQGLEEFKSEIDLIDRRFLDLLFHELLLRNHSHLFKMLLKVYPNPLCNSATMTYYLQETKEPSTDDILRAQTAVNYLIDHKKIPSNGLNLALHHSLQEGQLRPESMF